MRYTSFLVSFGEIPQVYDRSVSRRLADHGLIGYRALHLERCNT